MVNPIIANAGNYNLLGKMAAGQQIGQRMRQERRMNALAGVIGSEGLDSPKAQNLLAQLDPMAVSQMRQQESQFGRTMEQRDSQFGETMGLRREEMAFSHQLQRAQLNLSRAAAARAGANSQAALAAARRKEGAAILQTVMNLPPERQQQAYSMAVGMLAEYGMDPSSLPEEFSPEWAGLAVAQLSGAAPTMQQPSMLTPEEQRQAALVGSGLAPDANTIARAEGGNGSAAEQRIARLTENLSEQFGARAREIAVAITDGRYKVDQGRVIDTATGALITPTVQETAPSADPTRPRSTGLGLYDRADDATGVVPAIGRGVSATLGQLPVVGGLFQAPDMVGAGQSYLQAQNELIRSMSINPRFPVGEINRLREEMGILPGMLQSPGDVRVRLRELDGYLAQKIENERAVLNDPTIPRDIRDNAAQAIRDMEAFRSIAGVPQGGGYAEWMVNTDPATWTDEQWSEAEKSGFLNGQ